MPSSRPLLDVNLLLALAWPNHQFHEQARAWFAGAGRKGFSTCAVSQLGFVRLSANPAFTAEARTPREAVELLSHFTRHRAHRFLPDVPLVDEPFLSLSLRILGHGQVTDAHLLAVAVHHRVPLLTFDHRIVSYAPAAGAVMVL